MMDDEIGRLMIVNNMVMKIVYLSGIFIIL